MWRKFRSFLAWALAKFPNGEHWVEDIRVWRARRGFQAWVKYQNASDRRVSPRMKLIRSYGYANIHTQPGLIIDPDVTVSMMCEVGARPVLELGKRVYLGRHTFVSVFEPITVGDHTIIGAYCYIISANHRYDTRKIPIRDQGYTGAPIIIGEDVWIGTHVVILPGVTIGRGAIIAAGSLVNCNVPEYEVWGGMPARFLKSRPG